MLCVISHYRRESRAHATAHTDRQHIMFCCCVYKGAHIGCGMAAHWISGAGNKSRHHRIGRSVGRSAGRQRLVWRVIARVGRCLLWIFTRAIFYGRKWVLCVCCVCCFVKCGTCAMRMASHSNCCDALQRMKYWYTRTETRTFRRCMGGMCSETFTRAARIRNGLPSTSRHKHTSRRGHNTPGTFGGTVVVVLVVCSPVLCEPNTNQPHPGQPPSPTPDAHAKHNTHLHNGRARARATRKLRNVFCV